MNCGGLEPARHVRRPHQRYQQRLLRGALFVPVIEHTQGRNVVADVEHRGRCELLGASATRRIRLHTTNPWNGMPTDSVQFQPSRCDLKHVDCYTQLHGRSYAARHLNHTMPVARSRRALLRVERKAGTNRERNPPFRSRCGFGHAPSTIIARVDISRTCGHAARLTRQQHSLVSVFSVTSEASGCLQASPRHASMPSRMANTAITRAATASAHAQPSVLLSTSPSSTAAER